MYAEIFVSLLLQPFCFLIFKIFCFWKTFFYPGHLSTPTTHTHTREPRPLPTTHDPRHLATLKVYSVLSFKWPANRIVLFFLSFFSKTSASARERARSARNKNKERLQTSLGKKRCIKSLPHVNASSLPPPRSQYQLNWTNGIGDVNCLCYWLKYFTIKQQ